MSKRKIIIGAGISGLIFKYYNPDYILISPDIGGQLRFELAPITIFDTKETRSLLNELKVPYEIKLIKIKYFYQSKLYDNIDNIYKAKYVNKKLSHSLFKTKKNQVNNLILGSESNEYNSLVCNIDFLLKKLTKNIEIIKEKVILISIKNKYITLSSYNKFYFDRLISTIPAPDFTYLCFDYFLNNKFNYLPSTIIFCNKISPRLSSLKWDLLYYVDEDEIYNRITRTKDGFILEIPGDLSRIECEKLLGYKIVYHKIQRVSTIFSEKINNLESIKFVGRLATWESNYRIQDSIKVAKEGGQNNEKS